jgi:hypothetical protein
VSAAVRVPVSRKKDSNITCNGYAEHTEKVVEKLPSLFLYTSGKSYFELLNPFY